MNNFAITSGGLGDIIERGGAAMATANTSLERTLALGTAGNEILNNPERVGNGLKTLALRLRGSTIELQEAGEEIDEYVTSTSKMQEKIKAITDVDIMRSATEYKDVYEILDEIALVYKDLKDIDKAALTEALFGKNQANLGTAILTNFETARNVLKDLESGAAAGSATKEYEKWLGSLEAKVGKLGSTFERASIALFDDDMLGDAIDGLSSILSLVAGISEVVGSIPSLAGIAGALLGTALPEFAPFSINKDTGNIENIFSATRREQAQRQETLNNDANFLKQYLELKSHGEELTKQRDQLKSKMSDAARIMVENGRLTGASMNKFISEQQTAIDQTNVFTQSLKTLGAVGKSVGAVLGNMVVSMAIAWALEKGFEAINSYINATEIAIEKSDEFFSGIAESEKKMQNAYKVSHGDIAKRYAELAQGANQLTGAQGDLSTEEYEEFVSLGQEIAAQFPTLISGWDEQGRAVLRLKGSVEELTAALAKEYETIARGENLTNLKEFKEFGFEGAYAKLYNQDTGLFLRKKNIDTLYSDLSSPGAFEEYIMGAQSDDDLSRRLVEMMGYLGQDVDISDLKKGAGEAGKLALARASAEGVKWEDRYKIRLDAVKDFWIQNSVEVMTRINTARLELEAEYQAAWSGLTVGVQLAASETISKLNDQKQKDGKFVNLTDEAATMFQNMVSSHYLNAEGSQSVDEQTEYFQNYNEEIQAIILSTDEAGEAARAHLNNLAALQAQYAAGTITAEQYESEVQKINDALAADPLTGSVFDGMVASFASSIVTAPINETANDIYQVSESIDTLTASYTKFTEARTAGMSALSALSEKGYLTPEESRQIADAGLSGAVKRTQYGSSYVDYQDMRKLDKANTYAEIEKHMDAIKLKTEEAQVAYDALFKAQAEGNLAELNNQKAIIDTRKKEIEQINLMVDALEGSLSALNAFKQASSMGELGDNFRATKDALDAINDGLKSGRIGTNKFASAVELMFGENVLNSFRSGKTSRADLQKMMKSVGGFYDEDGNINRDAAFKRFIDADIASSFTNKSGEKRFAFDADTTMADIQEALGGVSEEMATYFLDAINEYAQGEHERIGPAEYLANYEERMEALQKVDSMAVQAGSVTINTDKVEDGSADEDRSAKDAKDRDKDPDRQKSTVAQEIADAERARNMESALQTIFSALQIASEETLAKDREESNRKKVEEATRRAEAEERARYAEHLAKEAKGRDQDLDRQKSTITQNAIEEEARNKRLDLITESRERAERAAAEAKLKAEQEAAALAEKKAEKKKVDSVLAGETSPVDYQKEQFQRVAEQFEQDLAEAITDAYKQGSDSPFGIMDSAGLKSFMGKTKLQAMQAMMEMTADTTSAEETNDELVEDIETEAVKPTSLDTTTAEQQSEALHATVSKGIVIPVSLGTPTNYPDVDANPRSNPTVTHAAKVDGGVAYANGNTLVGELAPEIIVDRKTGTWRLAEYPQLTHLNAGDIVFNGQQTKAILNGRKTGFSKTVGGKSNVDGNVKGGKSFAASPWELWTVYVPPPTQDYNPPRDKGGKGGGGSSGGSDEAEQEEKEWYDWIVKALELAKKATEKAIEDIVDKIGYIAKNAQIDKALGKNQNELEKNEAALARYTQQANLIASRNGLSSSMVNDIQNGKIDITEYDQETVEKIKEYEEWYSKIEECQDAIAELKKQEIELQRQKLDNIDEYYDKKIDRLEARLSKSSAQLDKKAAYGEEIVAQDYTEAIATTQEKLTELQAERKAYQEQFDQLVAAGVLEPDSDAWHEYIGALEEMDEAIVESQIDMVDLVDAMNDIPLTNLQYALERLDALQNRLEAFQSFHAAQGVDNVASTYVELIQNGFAQIDNLKDQNEILLKQQDGLDINSEKWQEIQQQIEDNESTMWSLMSAQEQWNDAIADLQIDRLREEREELEKANEVLERRKEMEDALEELEKARAQRTKLIYKDGVGFTYEADQDAIKEAQDRVDELMHQETLNKIDEVIEAIEKGKADDNVYNYDGTDVIKNFANLTGEELYDFARSFTDIGDLLANSLDRTTSISTSADTTNAPITISIGDIVLENISSADDLAQRIVNELPNRIIQRLYK